MNAYLDYDHYKMVDFEEPVFPPSPTVQDQGLTVREILDRYTDTGRVLPGQGQPLYDDDADQDNFDLVTDFESLDLEEQHRVLQHFQQIRDAAAQQQPQSAAKSQQPVQAASPSESEV